MIQGVRFGVFIKLFQCDAVFGIKRSRPCTAQFAHVAVATQSFAQITGNGADVAAFATSHFKGDMVCVGAIGEQQFFNP